MGNVYRKDEEPFFALMLRVAESSAVTPDVGIDDTLMKYSGLNSAAELELSITRVLKDVGRKTPDYTASLCAALSAFDKVSNAVGLGGLVLAVLLETMIGLVESSERTDSPLDMMRRVFAEEKASGVRDSMEEYMKRLGMCLHQPEEAIEETGRLERLLSGQLTRLKNSMLHDDQMSSRSMKYWINGAAFHLQMLIHAARLKTHSSPGHKEQLHIHVASISSVIYRYHSDLDELLKQYKTYKRSNIHLYQPSVVNPWTVIPGNDWCVKDKELGRETPTTYYHKEMLGSSVAYVDYIFDNWSLIKKLNSYFNDLKENLQELILQNTEFNLHNVLPSSDGHSA